MVSFLNDFDLSKASNVLTLEERQDESYFNIDSPRTVKKPSFSVALRMEELLQRSHERKKASVSRQKMQERPQLVVPVKKK